MSRTWMAFYCGLVASVLIAVGIYKLTGNVEVTMYSGFGIAIVIYFVCTGITSMANNISDIRKSLEKKT